MTLDEQRIEHRANDQLIMSELKGFKELFLEYKETTEKTLVRIEAQTIKTNGRVTKLELVGAEEKGKATVRGVIWAAIISISIAVVSFFINKNIA